MHIEKLHSTVLKWLNPINEIIWKTISQELKKINWRYNDIIEWIDYLSISVGADYLQFRA